MTFKLYNNVHHYYDEVYGVMMKHEVQNIIPLGNLAIGKEGKDKTAWRDPANWIMAAVSDSDGVQMTVFMTPPHGVVLYAANNKINDEAVNCAVQGLIDYIVPTVMAEKELAKRFAAAYTAAKNMKYELKMDQRIYELEKVSDDIKQFGKLRLVNDSDMPYLPFWLEAFYSAADNIANTTMLIPNNFEHYEYLISKNENYVLEVDGKPVSIAGISRKVENVICIGRVYTPPYFRGKGYASSCVAMLSQRALDMGFKKCALYTDLANPTSNNIYQKIGYKPICDSVMLKFI